MDALRARSYTEPVIYCVVPPELEEELYEKLIEYYKDNPNVKVIIGPEGAEGALVPRRPAGSARVRLRCARAARRAGRRGRSRGHGVRKPEPIPNKSLRRRRRTRSTVGWTSTSPVRARAPRAGCTSTGCTRTSASRGALPTAHDTRLPLDRRQRHLPCEPFRTLPRRSSG
jgi:hypothetical protein